MRDAPTMLFAVVCFVLPSPALLCFASLSMPRSIFPRNEQQRLAKQNKARMERVRAACIEEDQMVDGALESQTSEEIELPRGGGL